MRRKGFLSTITSNTFRRGLIGEGFVEMTECTKQNKQEKKKKRKKRNVETEIFYYKTFPINTFASISIIGKCRLDSH